MSEQTVEDYLIQVQTRILSAACEGAAYEGWSDDFARKHLREAWKAEGRSDLWKRRLTVAELCEVADEKLRGLGFGSWDGALTLIPLWAYNLIADGETLTSISDSTEVVGVDDIDLDVRFGCIAYGFKKQGAVTSEQDQ